MGFDITYHPVGADEICSLYFKGIVDPDYYKSLVTQFGLDDFNAECMRVRFEKARDIEPDAPFHKSHVYNVAIIFGFLRKHHYIRGSAFSFLADDSVMAGYISDWKTLVPKAYRNRYFANCLTENYCGGVYLSHDALKRLRAQYQSDDYVRSKMDELFSHGRLSIFWKVVDDAIAEGLGLVEASEVVEPNPFDLNSSRSLSNISNCHPDGVQLFAEAAAAQVAEVMKKKGSTAPSAGDVLAQVSLR